MKILMIGDFSNFHGCLCAELRRRGHEVTLVSDGGRYMDTACDKVLTRPPGLFGTLRYAVDVLREMRGWRGYDVVQVMSPLFLHLRPSKVRSVFDYLRRHNRHVCLTFASLDACMVKLLTEGDTFRYSEFRIGHDLTPLSLREPQTEREWTTPEMLAHCRYIMLSADRVMTALYEYHRVASLTVGEDKLSYVGIPVDFSALPEISTVKPGDSSSGKTAPGYPVRIFIGRKADYNLYKGTDILIRAARHLEQEMPGRVEVTVAENLPLSQYLHRLGEADIVLDQIYSYTPATNALQAMAMGKVAVTGGEPEYYDFIGARDVRPAVNVLPDYDDILTTLRALVTDSEKREALRRCGPEFVRHHNDVSVVADRFEEAWRAIGL